MSSPENTVPSASKSLVLWPLPAYRPLSRWQRMRRDVAWWTFVQLLPALGRLLRSTAAWCSRYLGPALRRRRSDLEEALEGGWDLTPTWVKVAAYLALTVLLSTPAVALVVDTVFDAYHRVVGVHTGLAAMVTAPVQSFLQSHDAGLSMSAASLYGLWQLAGVVLMVAALFGSVIGRIAWVAYGTGTGAMVWCATAPAGRPVAVAVVALLWALISVVALKGLSWPRPLNITNITNQTPPAVVVMSTAAQEQEW
jgi:hypothetical protein